MHAVRSTRPARAATKAPAAVPFESSARLDPLIGALVSGRYRIESLLASGGMGRVYRAIQEPVGRAVALKVVRHDDNDNDNDNDDDDDDDDDEAMRSQRRLRLEATILARLEHPNIVTFHDFGEIDGAFRGRSFLAMELLEGRTLEDCLAIETRLAPARVVAIAVQILRGLRAAHQQGVLHRDLKPSNVILLRDADGDAERVKLVDFGIGKLFNRPSEIESLTRTGAVLGTAGYLAPERLQNRASPASDLFALGVVLFLALTGIAPFEPTSKEEDAFAKPAPRVRDVAPDLDLPEGLESLLAALLARVPDNRPSATEALQALARIRERTTSAQHNERPKTSAQHNERPKTSAQHNERPKTSAQQPTVLDGVPPLGRRDEASGEVVARATSPDQVPAEARSWMRSVWWGRFALMAVVSYALVVATIFAGQRAAPEAPPITAHASPVPEAPPALAPLPPATEVPIASARRPVLAPASPLSTIPLAPRLSAPAAPTASTIVFTTVDDGPR